MTKPIDPIKFPKHYQFFDENSIILIASVLTQDEWLGFCKGNAMKYRIRAGKKDSIEKEIAKALNFEDIYKEFIHHCNDYIPDT
jgi:hypothetical protein